MFRVDILCLSYYFANLFNYLLCSCVMRKTLCPNLSELDEKCHKQDL